MQPLMKEAILNFFKIYKINDEKLSFEFDNILEELIATTYEADTYRVRYLILYRTKNDKKNNWDYCTYYKTKNEFLNWYARNYDDVNNIELLECLQINKYGDQYAYIAQLNGSTLSDTVKRIARFEFKFKEAIE